MQYLIEEPDFDKAMQMAFSNEPTPIQPHKVWTGDFMGMCTHDIPCPVCFDAPAVLTRNVTPGQWDQKAQPCKSCQKEGWLIQKTLPWWKSLLGINA